MTSIKEYAQDFELSQMKNIADLEVVPLKSEIKSETRQNADGKDYKVSYIIKDGEEYRITPTTIQQIKVIIQNNLNVESVKVQKSGTGMGTKYQVIPL